VGWGWNGFSYQSPLLPRYGGSGRGEAHERGRRRSFAHTSRAAGPSRPGATSWWLPRDSELPTWKSCRLGTTIGQLHGKPAAGLPGGFAGRVGLQPLRDFIGDAHAERTVGAAQQMDEPAGVRRQGRWFVSVGIERSRTRYGKAVRRLRTAGSGCTTTARAKSHGEIRTYDKFVAESHLAKTPLFPEEKCRFPRVDDRL